MRFAQGVGQVRPHHALTMLDEVTALSLLLLIIGHGFLIRGCFSISDQLPRQGGLLADRLDRTADLLDEMAQLIADLGGDGGPGPVAQTPSGPLDLLTMFLNSRTALSADHGRTSQPEWAVYAESADTPTQTEEDQPR